jgi:hypothetical protein
LLVSASDFGRAFGPLDLVELEERVWHHGEFFRGDWVTGIAAVPAGALGSGW